VARPIADAELGEAAAMQHALETMQGFRRTIAAMSTCMAPGHR
jgi:hypothetical protein